MSWKQSLLVLVVLFWCLTFHSITEVIAQRQKIEEKEKRQHRPPNTNTAVESRTMAEGNNVFG